MPGACGRTPLLPGQPCALVGDVRSCSNRCGSGQQICQDGFWQPCQVDPQQIDCRNTCGEGTALCSDDKMGICEVAPQHFPCHDACGDGTALCSDNKMGTCEVPDPAPASCTTGCGPGQKTCHAGVWGNCEYVAGPRPCTATCSRFDGDGSQSCVNGSWGACLVARREDVCTSACGTGKLVCDQGQWYACDAPQPFPPRLHAVIHDFTPTTNSDFERADITSSIDDRGVLLPDLGADGLPVFASTGATRTISGPQSFNTWYRDVPGVNLKTTKDLQLVASPGNPNFYVYENANFFPIDGELFGNYDNSGHNFHFTLMINTEFVYVGGETFSFTGDDDLWVFINRKLAIDLGGVHEAETASLDLDQQASALNISRGNRYKLDLFFAERHTISSTFNIHTSIADVGSCP